MLVILYGAVFISVIEINGEIFISAYCMYVYTSCSILLLLLDSNGAIDYEFSHTKVYYQLSCYVCSPQHTVE